MATLTLTLPDNTTQPLPFSALDDYTRYALRISINYAAQLGASVVLLVVLLLTTAPDKHTAPLFPLTTLALAANAVRLLLATLYFTGPFYAAANYFAGDFSGVGATAKGVEIAVLPLVLLLTACIYVALLLQVRALTATLSQTQRATIFTLSTLLAGTAWTARLALSVVNARAIASAAPMDAYLGLIKANLYLTTASFILFSLLFMAKLAVAIRRRRRLHMPAFGPLQILAIGAAQTLLLPALFAVLQVATDIPEMGSLVLTSVVLSLPLTSLWAAASLSNTAASARAVQPDVEGQAKKRSVSHSLASSETVVSEAETEKSDRKSFLGGVWAKVSPRLVLKEVV